MTALVVALGGTAVAASHLVKGDKLIKKHSLSGNRLKNHTITGTQVNLSQLGKVPSAANADHATSADKATSATSAAVAGTANNASNLGGAPAAAYEPAAHFLRTGLITAASGASATLAKFGPFTLTLTCTAGTAGAVSAGIDATSTVANSDGLGVPMTTAGTPYTVVDPLASGTTFDQDTAGGSAFFTPAGQTYLADLTVGQNYLSAPTGCYANAFVTTS